MDFFCLNLKLMEIGNDFKHVNKQTANQTLNKTVILNLKIRLSI